LYKYLLSAALSCCLMLMSAVVWSKDADLDRQLQHVENRFNLKPLPLLPDRSRQPLFLLGKSLYFDKILSGNQNVSCASCHEPSLGTSDGLPLSLGQGNDFSSGKKPFHSQGAILRRSSPSLYNLGYAVTEKMFWDNRVSYDPNLKQFTTPSQYLNGSDPVLSNITAVLPNALASQVLFPMQDRLEMRGMPGENEVADAADEKGAWQAIMARVLKIESYRNLLVQSYPDTRFPDDFNIGHLGKALGYFVESAFATPNTPYDAYLRGEHNRLGEREKKGMLVFFGDGGCFRCHSGQLLTNHDSVNVGVPIITRTQDSKPDEGIFEITGAAGEKYAFRTPGLRNIALTAPYMHNGAFATLEQVVEHYSNPRKSIHGYEIPEWFGKHLGANTYHYDKNATVDVESHLDPRVAKGLRISEEDKANLVAFLKNALTEQPQ